MTLIKTAIIISILGAIAAGPMTAKAQLPPTLSLPSIGVQTVAASALDVPVFDKSVFNAVVGRQTQEVVKFNLEQALKVTLHSMKRILLNRIVNQITDWIGGKGKPKFITDWQGFLRKAGDDAAGTLIRQTPFAFMCEPFSLQVRFALLPVKKFSDRVECTLNKVVSNIREFYRDFRNGGWIAYAEAWQPNNNGLGSLLTLLEELNLRKEGAALAALAEGIAGNGFLSVKQCQKDAFGRDLPETCKIITPGDTIGQTLAKAVGSDIDFIVNADELQEYASAIANALINRIVREGVAGLQAIGSDEEERSSSALYDIATTENFDFIKNSLLADIDATLDPRRQAAAILGIMLNNLNNYKKDLETLFTQFTNITKTICTLPGKEPVLVSQVKNDLVTELAKLDGLIAEITTKQTETQAVIDNLTAKRAEVAALTKSNENVLKLANLRTQLSPSLNQIAADDFRQQIQQQNDQVQASITAAVADFNAKLTTCLTSP